MRGDYTWKDNWVIRGDYTWKDNWVTEGPIFRGLFSEFYGILLRHHQKTHYKTSGMKLKGAWGETHPNLENLPLRRAKTVVQCISAGQSTGSRTFGQLLLLEKKVTDRTFCRTTSDTHLSPKKSLRLHPCKT